MLVSIIALLTIFAGVLASLELHGAVTHAQAARSLDSHAFIDCAKTKRCRDVVHSDDLFGNYVGHDEPANVFYSNLPGSGNRNLWFLKLPTDPVPNPGGVPKAGQTFNFELHPAFWFGLNMCDTQSYPEQVSTCTPDSDSNITSNLAQHPGTAFMELQFYPPGWAPFQAPGGISCSPTQWCAALNIDSVSQDPVNGTNLNSACAAITGLEYVNFAFLTKNGRAQAPANPVESTLATFTPDPTRDLFMNSGDNLIIKIQDTPSGLRTDVLDLTTHQYGFMVASAANSFGQVKFAPDPSTECTNIPYNFHPMYSTSSAQAILPWGGIPGNVTFSDEIGHFDYCNTVDPNTGSCSDTEGQGSNQEPADGDDNFCFDKSASSLIQVTGCTDTNTGFDGVPYQRNAWPDGNPDHPTPIQFSSPLTGFAFNRTYSDSAFQTDLPALEPECSPVTGAGCTHFPLDDDSVHAQFYPYYSSISKDLGIGGRIHIRLCVWQFGATPPGSNDFGKNDQYGPVQQFTSLTFGGHGATEQDFSYFGQSPFQNPCQPLSLGGVNALVGSGE